jgi:outer membrane protein
MRLTGPVALALSLLSATLAQAQQSGEGERLVTVGAGIQTYPRYPGADVQRTGPLPFFDIERPGEPTRFKAPDQGIGFGLLGRHSPIDIGPAVRWEYSRRSGRDLPAALPGVGFTVEAGGFAQAMLGDNFRLRAEGRKGIGGHRGAVLDLSADAIVRAANDATLFSIGPRLRLSDGRYQRAYFRVPASATISTGLAAYAPGGGVHAVGLWSSLRQRLGGPWGAYAFAGYDRLIGDAGRSPLIGRYGRRDELSGGVALTYSFRVRVPRL